MPESHRFWRNHVREALLGIRVPKEPAPERLLRRAKRGTCKAPSGLIAGQAYGDLVPVEVVGKHPVTGSKLWLCRCSCGQQTVRTASHLNQAVRRGRRPSCKACADELRRGQWEARRDALREAFRRQFVDYRTLWTAGQTARLMAEVLRDLAQEFGALDEEGFEVPTEAAAGYPWSYGDKERAARNWDRWHNRWDRSFGLHGFIDDGEDEGLGPLTRDELTAIQSLEDQ